MRDLVNNIGAAVSIAPAVASAAVTGAAVDTLGFEEAAVVLSTGAIAGAGDFGVAVQESDNNSDWTAVAAAELSGAFPATLEAASVYEVGYQGDARYVRVNLTKAGGTSIAAAAVVILSRAHERPIVPAG